MKVNHPNGPVFDMHNVTYRLLLLLFVAFSIVACSDEENTGQIPSLAILEGEGLVSQDTTIAPGQLMHFSVSARAGSFPLTQFLIRVISDSVQIYYDTGMYVQDLSWTGSFAKSFNDDEVWEFIVRDRYGQYASSSLNIKNDSLAGFGPVESRNHIMLGAQNNNVTGGFYSLIDQSVYFAEDAKNHQQDIEIIYYYQAEDEHVLAAPGSNIEEDVFGEEDTPVNWEYRNTTRYMPAGISGEQFDAIENDSLLLVSYIEGEGKRKAKLLVVGDIYSFKTQTSRFGMFRVNQLSGSETGSIEIDIKIQQ